MHRIVSLSILIVSSILAQAVEPPKAGDTSERKYLLDRIGDVAIVQLYVDGFDKLDLKEKTLIYHLSKAAVAGRMPNSV